MPKPKERGEHGAVDGTVLLVDDEANFAGLLAAEFEARRWLALRACSTEEALRLAGARRPSLVVADLVLGAENSLPLFAELRRELPAVPLFLLTDWLGPRGNEKALRAGATACFLKPTGAEELLNALPKPAESAPPDSLKAAEAEFILRMVERCGSKSAAARELNVDRRTLQRKLSKYGPMDSAAGACGNFASVHRKKPAAK